MSNKLSIDDWIQLGAIKDALDKLGSNHSEVLKKALNRLMDLEEEVKKPKETTNFDIKILPGGRLDPENAAKYLGMSDQTLATYRCRAEGPPFKKIMGKVVYFQKELDEWIESIPFSKSTAQARLEKRK